MMIDGYDEPLTLKATLTISDGGIHVDLQRHVRPPRDAASTCRMPTPRPIPCSAWAAWSPRTSQQCGLARAAHRVGARQHILNAPKPNAVASRHIIGQMLPDVTFGCLRQVVPDRVPAEGTSCLWNINVRGHVKGGEGGNYGFGMAITSNGGTARPDKDGLSATAYPSGVRGTPVEIAETQTPLIFWRKEFRPDRAAPAARAAASARSWRSKAASPSRSTSWRLRPHRLSGARPRRRPRRRGGLRRAEVGPDLEGQGLPAHPAGRPAGGHDAGRRRHRQARRARSRAGRQRPGRRADLAGDRRKGSMNSSRRRAAE